MPIGRRISALLVDPSRFTTPYDAGLSEGLAAAEVDVTWATRPLRDDEEEDLDPRQVQPFFYRRVERANGVPAVLRPLAKGLAHLAGLVDLVRRVNRTNPDVVHFQWTVLPLADAVAIAWIRRSRPVVLTVHDAVPNNGQRLSIFKQAGFDLAARLASHIVVHTRGAADTLAGRGIPAERVAVIPHGPLSLRRPLREAPPRRDERYTLVQFGSIKAYKGVDVLVEALAGLSAEARRRGRVIIAGDPRVDMEPIEARAAEAGLSDMVEFRLGRMPDAAVARLLAEADAFVMPYRQIDASGVYHLVRPLRKWIVASRVGVFAEDLDSRRGATVPPGDVAALTAAIEYAISARPVPDPVPPGETWEEIGGRTRLLYERLLSAYRQLPDSAAKAEPTINRSRM